MNLFRRHVTSEDIEDLPDLSAHPTEIPIGTFCGKEIADLATDAIHRDTLNDIARGIVDRGWRYGVRGCEITVRRDYRTVNGRRIGKTKMIARVTYA
jgi:hypothetical protein